MFKSVVGHSNDPDSLSAVEKVFQQCASSLTENVPQAGIILQLALNIPSFLRRIRRVKP
ncbi:hypothetical protein [Nostoc sp.]|uniref:hypothetical protein n=1 Tax=Nostoc sp. TaxID=1180 RepID=UPI002FF739CB